MFGAGVDGEEAAGAGAFGGDEIGCAGAGGTAAGGIEGGGSGVGEIRDNSGDLSLDEDGGCARESFGLESGVFAEFVGLSDKNGGIFGAVAGATVPTLPEAVGVVNVPRPALAGGAAVGASGEGCEPGVMMEPVPLVWVMVEAWDGFNADSGCFGSGDGFDAAVAGLALFGDNGDSVGPFVFEELPCANPHCCIPAIGIKTSCSIFFGRMLVLVGPSIPNPVGPVMLNVDELPVVLGGTGVCFEVGGVDGVFCPISGPLLWEDIFHGSAGAGARDGCGEAGEGVEPG